jgi:hypothetical protein
MFAIAVASSASRRRRYRRDCKILDVDVAVASRTSILRHHYRRGRYLLAGTAAVAKSS